MTLKSPVLALLLTLIAGAAHLSAQVSAPAQPTTKRKAGLRIYRSIVEQMRTWEENLLLQGPQVR